MGQRLLKSATEVPQKFLNLEYLFWCLHEKMLAFFVKEFSLGLFWILTELCVSFKVEFQLELDQSKRLYYVRSLYCHILKLNFCEKQDISYQGIIMPVSI